MRSRLPLFLALLTTAAVASVVLARRSGGARRYESSPDDDAIDYALDQSFPASDPPSWSTGDATAASRTDSGR